jgi:ankyrin repeat protein
MGSNPNVQDQEGISSLFWALFNGNNALVATLIEHGADPNMLDSDCRTALITRLTMATRRL